jgi:disulfide bond formation protein DsbB
MNTLLNIEKHIGIWLAVLIVSSAAILGALYFQYYLAWEPCVLCIQIRVIMAGIMLLSALMLVLFRLPALRLIAFIAQAALAVLLFIKSRAIYRVETGLDQAECMFTAGLPEWFNLEVWWPSVFEVRSACGDSPELLAGITMVEALYYASAASMLAAIVLAGLSAYAFTRSKVSSVPH